MKSSQYGISMPESIWVAAVVSLALFTPLSSDGLPASGGKPVAMLLADAVRAHHSAWLYALSMPGS